MRDDAIMATGRSDYPNQVNNVLCFPYIFRGALDVGARTVNDEMKIACVRALASLARKEPSEVVARAFGEQAGGGFGANQIIPKPFDPRLIVELAPAVAKAAMDSGVATRPIADFDAYRQQLSQFVFKSGLVMRPVFEQARANAQARDLQRRRGRPRAARRADHPRRGRRRADPDRPPRDRAPARRAPGPALPARRRRRADRSLERPALRPLLGRLSPAHGAARRHRAHGAQPGAHQPDPDRGAGGPAGRRRRHDRRHLRPLPHPFRPCARRHRHARGRQANGGAQPGGHADAFAVHRRHLRQRRARCRHPGRHHPAGGRRRAALRHPAQGGAALAFELRQLRSSLGAQDGGGGEDAAAARADLEVDGEMHGDAALDPRSATTSSRARG